jgi:ornithine cyclodeaminase/alanine dehydrogenase-like protein (mu-crystallin family)
MDDRSLLIDASDIRTLLRRIGPDALMDDLTTRLERAIRQYDPATAQVPARTGLQYESPEWGLLEWMPAHFGEQGTTSKLVAYHPANPVGYGMPSIVSTISMFDTRSGHLLALMDGTLLTAMRTGAASAVASRVLALPESRTLGVIGCGTQAVTQVHGLSRVFEIGKVIVYDVRDEVAATFAERTAFLDSPVTSVGRNSLGDLLARADILCTCTSVAPGAGPVCPEFEGKPHLHVNAVGSDFPGKLELPAAVLRRSLVCPDFREQAIVEGECQQLEQAAIGPDLVTLVQNADSYARSRSSPTVFDSTGWALEDHVVAVMVFEYARELGLGRSITLECLPADPLDPYSLLASPALAAALRPASASEITSAGSPRGTTERSDPAR